MHAVTRSPLAARRFTAPRVVSMAASAFAFTFFFYFFTGS
jgi:hypothetical protein